MTDAPITDEAVVLYAAAHGVAPEDVWDNDAGLQEVTGLLVDVVEAAEAKGRREAVSAGAAWIAEQGVDSDSLYCDLADDFREHFTHPTGQPDLTADDESQVTAPKLELVEGTES